MATNSSANSTPKQSSPNEQRKKVDDDRAVGAVDSATKSSLSTPETNIVCYDVEHLATFSTASAMSTSHETNNPTRISANDDENNATYKLNRSLNNSSETSSSPKLALEKLFELEKLSGIWTQRMQIKLQSDSMLIVDCETNSVVERFSRECVKNPEAFGEYNDIYNNIVVFLIQQQPLNSCDQNSDKLNNQLKDQHQEESEQDLKSVGELHIFQCVSHKGQQLVSNILSWKSESTVRAMTNSNADGSQSGASESSLKSSDKSELDASKRSGGSKPMVTLASSSSSSENEPIVNVNVKETVQVFNQIAAQREKSKPSSPTNTARPLSDGSGASSQPVNNASGGAELSRSLSSPVGRFHKQRSIRATLAPKYSDSPAEASRPVSESAGAKTTANELSNASGQPQASASRHREPDQTTKLESKAHGSSSNNTAVKSSSKSKLLQQRTQSSSRSHVSSSSSPSKGQHDQPQQTMSNESYVSVLNHCFDDIEKFIIRLQQAAAAIHELRTRKKMSKQSSSLTNSSAKLETMFIKVGQSTPSNVNSELAMLNARARGPNEDDYFEILSKFKLAFNLLAKLKGCIHEPNAPELVHFLFTPLAIIIESARNASLPIDPSLVGIPYLNQEALDLLSNCCTSKESDLWVSLGPNWTRTIDMNLLKASRLPSSFQPIFSDGWAPVIGELELIGLMAPPAGDSQALAGDSAPGSDSSKGHHHHRHHNLDHNPVPPIERSSIIGGYVTDQHSAARSEASKPSAHVNSYDHKKRNISTPSIRHSGPSEHSPYQTSQVPYGFMHDANDNTTSTNRELHNGHRISSDHPTQHMRFNPALDGQPLRRLKQRSRQDYPLTSNYDHSAHYPAMSLRPPTDIDSQLDADTHNHQNGAFHSDEYAELHDYIDDHYSKEAPGPSSNSHYREGLHSNNNNPSYNFRHKSPHSHYNQPAINMAPLEADYLNELHHESMLSDLGPAQTEWFYELQNKGALMVRVLFSRDANNDKELTVRRGEILEVLDDTRKWWRARNIDLQVAYIPHTIVAIMQGYQTLDELLASNPCDMVGDDPHMTGSQRFGKQPMKHYNHSRQWQSRHDIDKRNSAGGAFRYF